ncbi:MAG: type II toxin-antitoxin system Phd/YefM family antitoxin [Coxiellaceae bacterium]|nr:type II toxin-antitoxin system Phd/YefM family antitoxin [Coxiellaceae bacterium]
MKRWQLQEAKARFSEVVKNAVKEGPQKITVHGKTTAVVLSIKEYDTLTRSKQSFIDFLRSSPLKGVDLKLKRDKSKFRDINL